MTVIKSRADLFSSLRGRWTNRVPPGIDCIYSYIEGCAFSGNYSDYEIWDELAKAGEQLFDRAPGISVLNLIEQISPIRRCHVHILYQLLDSARPGPAHSIYSWVPDKSWKRQFGVLQRQNVIINSDVLPPPDAVTVLYFDSFVSAHFKTHGIRTFEATRNSRSELLAALSVYRLPENAISDLKLNVEAR